MRYVVCLLAASAGLLVTAFLVAVLAFGIRDARSVPDAPPRLDMKAAIEHAQTGKSAWVWLTDAAADCARFATFTDATQDGDARNAAAFLAVNPPRDMEIAVEARDVRECRYVASVNYIGMLKKLDADKRREFVSRGVAPAANTEWWLCTQCRPGGEWPGVIIVLVLLSLSGWLTLKIYQARRPNDL